MCKLGVGVRGHPYFFAYTFLKVLIYFFHSKERFQRM